MSMYVELLSGALESWVDELTNPQLVRYARTCRDALVHPGTYGAVSNAEVLVAEIAYDRALIRLCERHAVQVDTRAFLFPDIARAGIEAALRDAGVSLDGIDADD